MADSLTTAPKRRWLTFSLRTMFVVVAVGAVFLGWLVPNIRLARERATVHRVFDGRVQGWHSVPNDSHRLPLGLRMLRAEPFTRINLNPDWSTDDDLRYLSQLFPEATVTRGAP